MAILISSERVSMKGRIRIALTIHCALCNWWEDLDGSKILPAAKQARESGWKFSKKNGWICPVCLENIREEIEEAQQKLKELKSK